ncbi:ABATE domain-containing protein [Streptomyces chiangmaiensis]|uniref:ABATE domain-containing protein n=1 Tax=Streptomyces chiangmaiensis TaxID=766497 RepID=UPI0038B64D6A
MVGGMTAEGVPTSAPLLGEPLPVELMNTVSVDRGRTHDALDSDAGATAWLRAVADRFGTVTGIRADQLDEDTMRPVAGTLRDALRQLAAAATEDPRPPATAAQPARPEAITTLNVLAQAWLELVWPADGQPRTYRGPGTPADLAVELIAHQGVELFTGADRDRLRPCLAPNCLLGRGHRGRAQRHPDAADELDHGAVGAGLQARAVGPHVDLRPASSPVCLARVRGVLQRAQAAPGPCERPPAARCD